MMDIIDFLYQAGALRRVDRSGWKTIGIPPESVSEHSHRTAIIAYFIAKEEGEKDIAGVLLAALLHDLHESLTTDLHLVAKKYAKVDEDAARKYSMEFSPELLRLFKDARIMRIVDDADKLECALQAKEYLDLGNRYAESWIRNAAASLKTKTAKSLLERAAKRDAFAWLLEARK